MINADAEGNVNIPGQARLPEKKNGLSVPYASYFQNTIYSSCPAFPASFPLLIWLASS
jgi:hypothetical protein